MYNFIKKIVKSKLEAEIKEWEDIVVSIVKDIEADVTAEIKASLSFK